MYSPPLESHIRSLRPIQSGSNWEIELRGASIWCVELIKREIEKRHPEVKAARQHTHSATATSAPAPAPESADTSAIEDEKKCTTQKHSKQKSVHEPHVSGVNAILIDFFLYDTMKAYEADGRVTIPHHRKRSIWY